MISDKILIVDDKASSEDYSTYSVLETLSPIQKERVEYHADTRGLWKAADNEDEVVLLTDFKKFSYIFIHDSFNDPLLPDGLLPVLINELSSTSKVVLFSGSKPESNIPLYNKLDSSIATDIFHYEVLRRQYHSNFSSFIDSFFMFGEFRITYLYNSDISPYKDRGYELLNDIMEKLESSTIEAVYSKSFRDLLTLYNYEDIESVSRRFEVMSVDEIIETLEDLVENN
ncbi:hypothetical protein [Rufibacter roseus]|uniref:Response regulator n=1 Tax=Rufibacter roseus TaxID=1567108 RepID=A0ABW2DKB7_9BACT|nr:hypothetical protein [Rufibacter roseus]